MKNIRPLLLGTLANLGGGLISHFAQGFPFGLEWLGFFAFVETIVILIVVAKEIKGKLSSA